jgi:hypothetical protein
MSYAYWEHSTSTGSGDAVQVSPPAAGRQRTELVQIFAGAIGAVFVLVGILGFVPGITQMFGDFALFGRDSKAELLGIFQVSALHNVVHLLFGVGLLAARRATTSTAFLVIGGILYGVVGLYGSLIDRSSEANFLPFNHADNLLHFALAGGMVLLGLGGGALARQGRSA